MTDKLAELFSENAKIVKREPRKAAPQRKAPPPVVKAKAIA
jgi:hypothetical protein